MKKCAKLITVISIGLIIINMVGCNINREDQAQHANSESINATIEGDKFVHISIDDVIDIFKDLTINQNKYSSIFENKTLKYLKSLNEEYGAVFSLYCFYEYNGHSLENTTDKFKQEFMQSKDWLKFGVHMLDETTTNYANTSADKAQSDYNKIVNELIRITGSIECIDVVPRLQNFAGNLESMIAMRETDAGIKGLLSADDDRQSYYLSEEVNDFGKSNDRYYDEGNNIVFFATDLRLELIEDIEKSLKDIDTDEWIGRRDELIIFTHENYLEQRKIKRKLDKICKYSLENGYVFDFPMNRLE